MLAYTIKRIGLGLLILIGVMFTMYAAVFIVPGNPARAALGPRATQEMIDKLTREMGLDQPYLIQVYHFFVNVLSGNLGIDVISNRPVAAEIWEVLPNTLILCVVGLGWATLLAIPLGCLAVLKRGTWVDRAASLASVSVISLPYYMIAIYALLIFAVQLNWLPAIGDGEIGDIGSQIRALILPAFAIGLTWVGYLARLVRASMLDVMGEPHIRTARAFGVPEWKIVTKYGLRIALIPTLSLLAVSLGGLISSAVFVEVIFSRPGIGKLVTSAVNLRNYPVVMGTVLVMTAIYVALTIAVDLTIARLDPRIRDAFAVLEILKRVTRDPLGLLGLVLVVIILGAAIFADVVAPYDPAKIDVLHKLQDPTAAHWLGTDQLGRDTLSRVIYGARVAMGIAVFSIGIGAFIGLILGILAGYGPRWLDAVLIFFFDSLSAIPLILFALTVIVILGPGTSTLIFVIAMISIPVYGRLVRAQTLSLRRSEFILAEQSMGAGLARIIGIHLLPNVLGPLVILVSMDIPTVVALEAALSYLGLGVKPPTPSWGTILNDGYVSLRTNPALVIAAGIPLVIATLGFTFLGEALRDALDPKLKGRRSS